MARRLPKGWVRRLTSDGFEITPDKNSYHGLRLAKLRQIMGRYAAGDTITVTLHRDSKSIQVKVKLVASINPSVQPFPTGKTHETPKGPSNPEPAPPNDRSPPDPQPDRSDGDKP